MINQRKTFVCISVTDFPLWSSIIVVALGSAIYTTMVSQRMFLVWKATYLNLDQFKSLRRFRLIHLSFFFLYFGQITFLDCQMFCNPVESSYEETCAFLFLKVISKHFFVGWSLYSVQNYGSRVELCTHTLLSGQSSEIPDSLLLPSWLMATLDLLIVFSKQNIWPNSFNLHLPYYLQPNIFTFKTSWFGS